MAKYFALALCGLAILAAPQVAPAAVVFSQSSDVISGIASDQDFPFETADNFVLGGNATIASVTWFGGYDFSGTTATAADDFTISFYTDAGGAPAQASFASYVVGNSVNRIDTGANYSFGSDHFQYSANIAPTALTAGTQYYISIVNNTTGAAAGDDWFWGSSGVADTNEWDRLTPFSGPWVQLEASSLAFDLVSGAVPEPTTLLLLGLGLAGMGFARRRLL